MSKRMLRKSLALAAVMAMLVGGTAMAAPTYTTASGPSNGTATLNDNTVITSLSDYDPHGQAWEQSPNTWTIGNYTLTVQNNAANHQDETVNMVHRVGSSAAAVSVRNLKVMGSADSALVIQNADGLGVMTNVNTNDYSYNAAGEPDYNDTTLTINVGHFEVESAKNAITIGNANQIAEGHKATADIQAKTIKLALTGGNALQVQGDLKLTATEKLEITGSYDRAIRVASGAIADIDVDEIAISGASEEIKAAGGDLYLKANKGTIESDIVGGDATSAGVVDLDLGATTLTGKITTGAAAGSATKLTLNDGIWNVTGASNLTTLSGKDSVLAIDHSLLDGDEVVSIDQNDATGLTVKARGVDLSGGAQAALQNLDAQLQASVASGNADAAAITFANATTNTALYARDVTLNADGTVTTTMDTDTLVVAGDVVAGDVSLVDTAKQADQNKSDIAANKTAIAANTTAIATNTANIATNTADITAMKAVDTELGNRISENTTDIATNKADIAANKADIATNKADIATNKADIATNKADIATNATNIAANTQAIGANANAIAGLNQNVMRLDGRLDKVGAGAAALAALHPLDYDAENKLSFSAGVGSYGGATAGAIGAFYRPNEDVMFSIGGTAGNGENMVNAGVSFAIGKGSSGVAKLSKAELVQEVEAVKAENEALKEENKDIRNELNKLKAMVLELAAKK